MLKRVTPILLLILIWCGFSNNFHPLNILLGLIAVTLLMFSIPSLTKVPAIRFFHLIKLLSIIAYELLYSSLQVAWEIMTPTQHSRPATVWIPITLSHPTQVSLLCNIISLTPGTLVLDVNSDTNTVLVHLMFKHQEESVRQFINQNLEPNLTKAISYD